MSTGVPLQRPVAFAGKTFFTKEEFEQLAETKRKAVGSVTRIAPVEAVGVDWLDTTLYVEDLRTSLITYLETGRLPALVGAIPSSTTWSRS